MQDIIARAMAAKALKGGGGGVSTMLSIDSTEYEPTVTDDGEYQNVESSAEIKYSGEGEEHSTQVDFNIKVPKPDLSGKLDKVTTTDSSSVARFYKIANDGKQTVGHIFGDTGNNQIGTHIGYGFSPCYVNGCLVARSPVNPYQCATKKYVDDNTQGKLYVHEGTVSIDGYYNRYRILSKKSTAFTNPETDFPEHDNLFTLRTGSKMLYNLWYDDSDRTWYYTNSTNIDTEDSSYNVSIVTDCVYPF